MVTSPYRQPGCNRVDVFVDRYDRVPSIKSGERQRRSPSNPSLEVMIRGPNTPKRWNTFIAVQKKKANLVDFLSSRLCELAQAKLHHVHQLVLAGGFRDEQEAVLVRDGLSVNVEPALKTNHEEADTGMLLHDKDASLNHRRVIIIFVQSPDTDVLVLCTCLYTALEVKHL